MAIIAHFARKWPWPRCRTGFTAALRSWRCRFKRRFYATVLATALLAAGMTFVTLYLYALSGWFAGLTSAPEKQSLGAWITMANVAGGGAASIVAIRLLRDLPYVIGAAALSLLLLAPLPLLRALVAPPADGRLASESFIAFFRDVFGRLRRRSLRWMLFLFVLPAACFALTNVLGGLGGEYHASERLTGFVCGVGGMIAGVIGRLIVPRLSRFIAPLRLCLMIGGLGALFTCLLIVLPHTPAIFALAWLFESMFQASAFAVESILILEDVGEHNPLAATHYAFLNTAACVPLTIMGMVDGRAYAWRALEGMYLVDGGLGLLSVVLLALVWRFAKRP